MKNIQGFWFPDHDGACNSVILTEVEDAKIVFKYVKDYDVCVQAGGNVGVFAKLFSHHFKYVYSFEPDPQNFRCMKRNIDEENVFMYQAGLGDKRRCFALNFQDGNCGAHQVSVVRDGYIPTMRVDDLNLPSLGLLFLDIEGFELFAIHGAIDTIIKYRPVIVCEDKNCSVPYGYQRGDIEKFLKTYKYETAERYHGGRDVILIPK